jgi:hypothetical protein
MALKAWFLIRTINKILFIPSNSELPVVFYRRNLRGSAALSAVRVRVRVRVTVWLSVGASVSPLVSWICFDV